MKMLSYANFKTYYIWFSFFSVNNLGYGVGNIEKFDFVEKN